MLVNTKGEVVQVQARFRNHVEREAALAPIREVLAVRSSTGPMFGIEARARLTQERKAHGNIPAHGMYHGLTR